ncbi:restriction endonuclease subunit S [uncultured Helicobacter sp.]|uniref:restriction endonuclease subunit S n=1 Tax=uncultured Helicobacter sp. TaxID=175537 RepID=UPI00260E6555|nr:restriction endonuclease subunit S [uncultured Helicobacter sp.]
MVYQDDIENKKDISNDDKSNYKIVPLNAVAYNKMRMWQGAVGVNTLAKGIVSPAYIVAIPNEKILPFFTLYLLKSKIMIGEFEKNSYGLCLDMNNLRYEDFRNIKVPLPPLQEQKEIAEFLDSKCEKIENFITKKQSLITLLQEKKQALINEAVCGRVVRCHTEPCEVSKNTESKRDFSLSLKMTSSYKPSGTDYLGTIPKHWKVRRVATLGKFFKGSNISKNDLQDSGVSVILYGDIYTKYEIKTRHFQSKIAENFAKDKTQILCGDLLFSGSGETKEDIGKCICYLGNEKAYVGGDVIVLRQMGQDSLFLSYVLNSDYTKYQKAVISKGEIIIHIYASNLRDLKIPLPPLQEQKEIAEFLDSKIAQIDLVIEKTKKQITLIKEYKNTLINEAVCGRITCSRDFSPTAQNDKNRTIQNGKENFCHTKPCEVSRN